MSDCCHGASTPPPLAHTPGNPAGQLTSGIPVDDRHAPATAATYTGSNGNGIAANGIAVHSIGSNGVIYSRHRTHTSLSKDSGVSSINDSRGDLGNQQHGGDAKIVDDAKTRNDVTIIAANEKLELVITNGNAGGNAVINGNIVHNGNIVNNGSIAQNGHAIHKDSGVPNGNGIPNGKYINSSGVVLRKSKNTNNTIRNNNAKNTDHIYNNNNNGSAVNGTPFNKHLLIGDKTNINSHNNKTNGWATTDANHVTNTTTKLTATTTGGHTENHHHHHHSNGHHHTPTTPAPDDVTTPRPDDVTDKQAADWSAPDGGFGWVVVMSSFLISMLVDGVCFSFGMFVEDFKEAFDTDNATVSWIGSVLNGTYMFVGPLVSALCNIYGCRPVAFSGCVIAAAAMCVSIFSGNVVMLIFTFGFLGGVGFGFMYLPAIVMVASYFRRRRALATGIACCGSGMGAFLFAPLCQMLLAEFGWQGSLLILSGLVLNGTIFTMFYRPPPAARPISDEESRPPTPVSKATRCDVMATRGHEAAEGVGVGEEAQPLMCEDKDGVMREGLMPDILNLKPTEKAKSSSALLTLNIKSPGPTLTCREYHGTEMTTGQQCCDLDRPKSVDFEMGSPVSSDVSRPAAVTSSKRDVMPMLPLQRKDIFYSGSLSRLAASREDTWSVRSHQTLPAQSRLSRPSLQGDKELVVKPPENKWAAAFRSIFDVSLLKSPTFIIYCLSCFFCMAGFFVPFIYMPAHAMAMGIDKKSSAFLISIIGITNIIGRVGVGYISDLPWADSLLINNLALITGGVATACVPFYQHYWTFGIYSAVFGLSIAVFVSLRSIIMVELMGLEKLTTAFGFVVMCQGLSSFIGAPIAGAVSDASGSYDYAFYMAGCIFTMSGVICLPLRRVAKWEGLMSEVNVEVKGSGEC